MTQHVIGALKASWAEREAALKRDGQSRNAGAVDFMAGAVSAIAVTAPNELLSVTSLAFKASRYGAQALDRDFTEPESE